MLISRKKNHSGNLIKEYGKDLKDPGIYKMLTPLLYVKYAPQYHLFLFFLHFNIAEHIHIR